MGGPQDIPTTGTVVIRSGRIILASDGAAALLRHAHEALQGMALVDLFAPEDRARIADRYERRMRGEPVPSDYEAVVLRADGTRATFDLHVDREGRDVVIRYRDITAQMARRTRLQALATLGAAIQRERTEAEILDRIRTALPGLGISPLLMRAMPEGVRVEWSVLPKAVEGEFRALFGRELTGFTGSFGPFSRKAWEEGVAFTDDWGAEAARFIPEPFALRARELTSTELSRAIAVRIDERAGPRFYLVLACSWLRGEDLAAGQLFGAQVAAALDAASAIADLSRRNAELAALNRLGELAGELEHLDDFLRQADLAIFRASGAVGLAVYLVREDEGLLRRIHESLLAGPSSPQTCPLASAAGDAVRERTARVVPEGDGPAEVACVPLLARGKALGLLCARFAGEPGVAQARLELLDSFAAHYAGAIQSHQLVADLRRRLSDLTAVHAVTGRIFEGRPGDVAGMLRDGCGEVSAALSCPSVVAFLVEEGGAFLRGVAVVGPPLDPGSLRFKVAQDGLAAEAIRGGAPVWSPDATRDPRSALHGRRDVPRPAVLVVPLLARGATRGVLYLACEAGRSFSDAERALAMALAGELAMGLENAELHAAAKEQVRLLSLLGEMGRTLAGSLDLDQVLAVGIDAARRLLATDRAFVLLGDSSRGDLRVAAATGLLARELVDEFRPTFDRSGVYRQVVRERRPVAVEDMDAFQGADPAYRRFGSRAMLAVPLLSRGEVSGALVVDDCHGSRRFTEAEQERAVAVANRLAVAIENARLYAEARGRLSELSTVIDVARVVSSTLDLEEVLSAGAEHLKQTLRAAACTILLEDRERRELRRAAHRGPPAGPDVLPLDRPSLAREALAARAPLTGRLSAGEAASPVLAVPLHVRDQPVGVALVAAGEQDQSFTAGELSRAMAIASQLAVAVDNARLYQEARRRAEELALLHEVGRSLVASLDIETVLQAGVRNLARMVDAPAAMLALATPDGQALELRAVWGGPPGVVGRRPFIGLPGSLGALAITREPILVEDAANDPRVHQDLRAEFGGRAYLLLPLLVRERFIGSAVIVDDRHPRRFTPAEVERATAVANQLAVAVENARLYEDLRLSYEQLAKAQQQLVQRERLAALGELSAVVAHEVRNPLGVIFNSLGSLRLLLRPEGDARLLLDIVGEEADRLNRIVGDLLDFARPVTPVLRPEPLEQVVDQAVASAVGDSGVLVERDVDPDLPPVALDARLFHQALVNVAANAVQAMPRGGRLSVRVRRDQGGLLLEVADTGPGIPEEIRPRIFEPFFTTKASGTGLGLAVVKRIVEGHGGDISVSSRPGTGTVVRIRLPVAVRTARPVESGGGLG